MLAAALALPACGGQPSPGASAGPSPAEPPAFSLLRASSQQIVNAQGEVVRLRGVNLGGWLVKEGYILHFPGPRYDSPSEIDRALLDLAGPTLGPRLLTEYREEWITEDDFVEVARLGFDSVRLPLHYALLWDAATNQPKADGFAFLDRVVSWAEAHRLWIFLDLHCAPGGQNAGNISDSDGVARLYSDPRNQASTVLLWREIAARYQNRDAVGGYDLLNEPVWSSGADVAGLYRRLVDAVRAVDSRHLIILEGNTWATDLSIFGAPWDTNLTYSFHKYWDDTSDASIERFLSFSREWNVPLWLGETGENSADWYSSALGLVTRHGIGWCFWPWKKVWTDNDPLSVEPAPGTFSHITDYLDGKGPRPTRDETATGVRAMLRAATVESCRRNTDVIAVLQAN